MSVTYTYLNDIRPLHVSAKKDHACLHKSIICVCIPIRCVCMSKSCVYIRVYICVCYSSSGTGACSWKLPVSFAQEPYKRDDILQTRPTFWSYTIAYPSQFTQHNPPHLMCAWAEAERDTHTSSFPPVSAGAPRTLDLSAITCTFCYVREGVFHPPPPLSEFAARDEAQCSRVSVNVCVRFQYPPRPPAPHHLGKHSVLDMFPTRTISSPHHYPLVEHTASTVVLMKCRRGRRPSSLQPIPTLLMYMYTYVYIYVYMYIYIDMSICKNICRNT